MRASLDIRAAVVAYYGKLVLTAADIMQIWGVGRTVATRMKNEISDAQRAEGIPFYNAVSVDARFAFDYWNLDISDLEKRLSKITKYGLAV